MAQAQALPTAEDRIRAASWFAGQGFGIFSVWSCDPATTWCRCPKGPACGSPGKHPVTPKGFHDATRDPERISRLLSAGSEPNYGLVCPPGVFAWDIDGPGFPDRLLELQAYYGPLPGTLTTLTAHGLHMFWRWPDGLPIPAGEMFGWVTRWGAGRGAGYVIGPRSVHQSGAVYAPEPGQPLTVATLPTRWANAALGPSVAGTGAAGLPPVGGEATTGYQLPDDVRAGNRYKEIIRYTAHLYNRGLTTGEMWDLVAGQLAPRFREQLDLGDLRDRFDRATADMAARLGPPVGRAAAGAGAQHKTADDDGGDDWGWLPLDEHGAFPIAPADVAYGGLLGELVDAMAQGNDASRVGLLGCALAFAGALVPGAGYWAGRWQTTSPYVCLVGESGVGRKGTAIMRTHDTFAHVMGIDVVGRTVLDGVASGEGLVSALAETQAKYPGERTARLLFEEEFVRVLAIRGREGSTVLDAYLRQAFDGGPLSNHKADSEKSVAGGTYWLPALVAITPSELRARLEGTALTSGSGNRWLYLPVTKRTGAVAQDSGYTPADVVDLDLQVAFMEAYGPARGKGADAIVVPADVQAELRAYSDWLPGVTFGVVSDLSRRLPVLALRVALTHAAVERASSVSRAHLERALALTEYARQGMSWVFGPTAGSPDARHLLRSLWAAGGRMARNVATQRVLRDQPRLTAASDELMRLGLARTERVLGTGGRPRLDLVAAVSPGVGGGTYVPFVDFATGTADGGQDGGQRGRATRAGASVREAPRAAEDDNPDDNPDNLHESPPTSTNGAADNLHDSRTKAADNSTQDTQGADKGVYPDADTSSDEPPMRRQVDGSIYCYFAISHVSVHRDVATKHEWCEICSPPEV